MDFSYSDKVKDLLKRLRAFMDEHIHVNELRWTTEIDANSRAGKRRTPVAPIEELKPKARATGLWNLWWPKVHGGTPTSVEHAPSCLEPRTAARRWTR